jgi:hypothetical protein
MRKTIIIIIVNFAKAGSDELDYFKEQVELYFGRKLVIPEDQQKNKNVIVVNEHLFVDDKKYLEGVKPEGCNLAYVSVDDNQIMDRSTPWADLCIDESDMVNEP